MSPGDAPQGDSAGLQWFSTPVPVPRVPDVSDGTYRLVFASEQHRAEQHRHCQTKVLQGCLTGLRAGCSVQATRQCTPPPLLRLLGLAPQQSWEEGEACRQRCMDGCLAQQTPACEQHARDFCADAFSGPVADSGRRQQATRR